MKAYLDVNRSLWDRWTRIHATSAFYDVDGFKAGRSSLTPLEREELGDVAGKTLLHLQCHFGLDTLSWARLGATVTGIDFSREAVTLAQSLSDEMKIPATFVCTDVYGLPARLDARFDVVFTSYGVLPWLPDLERWAAVVAHFLKPGGTFYLVEFHPFASMLDDDGARIAYTYFYDPDPLRHENEGSYADEAAAFKHPSFEWPHGLGEIVTALLKTGLRLDFVREHPYSTHPYPPFVEEDRPGRYIWKKHPDAFPLLFSIKATKTLDEASE